MTYKGVEITGTSFKKATIKILSNVIENGVPRIKATAKVIGGTDKSIKKEIDKAIKQGHPVI